MKVSRLPEGAFCAREANTDKYSAGVVAIYGGSRCYVSAPVIAALGARAGGAGLVKLVVPCESISVAATLVPEAVYAELGTFGILPRADVYVMGMGLGVDETIRGVMEKMFSVKEGKFLFDADALTILAERCNDELYCGNGAKEVILTPHEGEAARLLGVEREAVANDRLGAAKEIAAKFNAICVLKGNKTIVASYKSKVAVYKNNTGNPYMALGGMGDLLSGVIGARWAYLKDSLLAAKGGVWLHGKASDTIIEQEGDPSIQETARIIGSLRAKFDKQSNSKNLNR